MKAAVLHKLGEIPRFEDFPEPAPEEEQVIVKVKAASLKNIDRMLARGSHYDSYSNLPVVVGIDGVAILEDGTRIYTGSHSGMMAEKATVSKQRCVSLPDNIDNVTAAALPNPALSAWLALSYRAKLRPGETILIMGATGVTGKLAVQLAKYFGAGRIVATGRNKKELEILPLLGADTVISLEKSNEELKKTFEGQIEYKRFDIVLDYIWGHYAEVLLDAMTGHDLNAEAHRTRYIQIGEMAGATIKLSAATLRSSAIELYGQGGGSIPKDGMAKILTEIIPKLFNLAAEKKLVITTEEVPLKDIERVWRMQESGGKRIVIMP